MMEAKIANMVILQNCQQPKLTAECEEKRTETQITVVSFGPKGIDRKIDARTARCIKFMQQKEPRINM